MRRYRVTEGTQDEILTLLDRLGRDRTEQGRLDKAEVYGQAWRDVRNGESCVEIGSAVYRVVDDGDD